MRICPSCGFQSTDDANFCPMCATRMPAAGVAAAPPPAAAPASLAPPRTAGPETATAMDTGATAIAGRFLMGPGHPTPTGTLHEAHDTQHGGAAVSVKLVPHAVLPTAQLADRALRELKQLAKVSSERILKVVDQGRGNDGNVYVVTEVAPGQTLEELVGRDGPLPVDRATAIVLQVGEALTEAQKVGVIHRDVAPRNVFVAAGDKVKLGDFGVAEPVTDKVFGAPAYVSPEQVEGKPVDQRSNIYSLGATYYFALTGRPPFDGDPQSLLQQHLNAAPQPPSSRRPGIPAELDRIVLKALEKSGGRRHLTLRQLLSEVEAAAHRGPEPASVHTVVDDAPHMGVPAHRPAAAPTPAPVQSHRQPAATVMGMASPMAAPVRQAPAPSPAPTPAAPPAAPRSGPPSGAMTTPMAAVPATTAPSMPVAAAPITEAPTVMGEAPKMPPAASPPVNAASNVQAAVAAAQAQVAAKKAAQPAPAAKGGFRETAWFKKGEIEEEMAKAQAEAGGGERSGTTGQHGVVGGEVDQSAIDVSATDKARLSLKTGATQAMAVVKMPQGGVPGDVMSEQEMLAEIDSSKKWFIIAGVAVAVVVLALVLWFVLGKKEAEPAKAEAPSAKPEAVAAAPPAAATPTPLPPAPSPPPPSADTPEKLLAAAEAAAHKGNLALAVDELTRAITAGADGGKLQASLLKAATAKQASAKKKRDRAGAAEAQALVTRLKSLRAAKKKH